MGFPFGSMKLPNYSTYGLLLTPLYLIKFMFAVAFIPLGLLKRQELENRTEEEHTTNSSVMLMDEHCPVPVRVPLQSLTKLIKKRLPVVTYQMFLEKQRNQETEETEQQQGAEEKEEQEREEMRCSVCLECFEGRQEVRELLNCCHVFHKDCLDSWIDVGQFMCPVCRSMLLPDKVSSITRTLLMMAGNDSS